MEFVLALLGALSLSSIPLILGWRSTADEAALARQLGIAPGPKKFDPEKYAQQTGTGLTWNQIAMGYIAWIGGCLFAGLTLGLFAAILFGIAGGLLYAGTLADRRQEFRLQQAKDILRGLGVIDTLLRQGKVLFESLSQAAGAVGPAGQVVLQDLVTRLRACQPGDEPQVVKAWRDTWDNPAVDIVETILYSHFAMSIDVIPMIQSLQTTLAAVVEILSRARSAAKGIEWQAKFLAVFPPLVLVLVGLTTPEAGKLYAHNPIYLLPVLLGSALSYWLTMRMVRNGLSIEASMGLQKEGNISPEKMGAV